WTVLASFLERPDHPCVVVQAATQSTGKAGGSVVWLIDHVDHGNVGITLAEQANVLLDFRRLLAGGQSSHPSGLLTAPNESVLLVGDPVALGELVVLITLTPVHLVARRLDGVPLAFVFGGQL